MELELSRGTVYAFTVFLLACGLALFGWTVTPVAGDGEPLVLSPAYVATMRYLQTAQGWLKALERLDADLIDVLTGDGSFYDQGRDAERVFEGAVAIARAVEQTQTPPSLIALQTAFDQCADAYVEVARSLLVYVSAPSLENQDIVGQEREIARAELESLRAMQEEMWPRQ